MSAIPVLLHSATAPPEGAYATLRALWPYVWRFRLRILVAMVFLVGAKVATIGVSLLIKQIVDALDPKLAPLTVPMLLLATYGALRLATTLFTELRQIVFARVMARTARSASSGRGSGVPKVAMMPSPMNLSSVPPCSKIARTMRSW